MSKEEKLMQKLARFIKNNSEESLNLEALSKQAGLSSSHLQRRFKAIIGVSPKDYLISCRTEKLKNNLRKQEKISSALYGAGFTSTSRVYEKLDKNFGMTPKQYQKQGFGLEISYAAANSPIGKIMVAATDRGICFLQFGKTDSEMLVELRKEFPKALIKKINPAQQKYFVSWMKLLALYLKGEKVKFNLPLDIQGTAFQIKVWKFLLTIPRGEIRSYKQVAAAIGQPKAIRAVATACGSNNVSIIIPCHRVLRGTGELAGYRWGLEYKKKLLEIEKNEQSTL